MATPPLVTITGTLHLSPGVPDAAASVSFTRKVFARHADGTLIQPGTTRVTTEADGDFTLAVMPTDHPDWVPVGWTYRVFIDTGDSQYRFNAAIPHDTPGAALTLGELIPLDAVSAGQMYALANHSHAAYVTDTELAAALAGLEAPDLSGYVTDGELTTALAPKAPLASPTFTGTVSGITAAMVGLGAVNNTSDAAKPISTAAAAALAAKADLVGGVIPTGQIPAIALVTFLGESANQAAMLAKVGQPGDFTIRTDTASPWVVTGPDPTQLASWTELPTGLDGVTSVNGQTGAVVLGAGDVSLGNVDDTADIDKPVSTAQQAAIAAGDAAVLYTASLAYDESQAALASAAGKVSKTGDTMTGPLTVRAANNSKGYRLRQEGGALDLEFGAAEMWIAGKSGVDGDPFGGDQYVVLKLRPNQLFQTAVGKWEWTDGPYGGARHELDGTTGVARLGSKNGLAMIPLVGYKDSPGAPTTDTWSTGEVVLDSLGVWHRCTAGGSPGTWT